MAQVERATMAEWEKTIPFWIERIAILFLYFSSQNSWSYILCIVFTTCLGLIHAYRFLQSLKKENKRQLEVDIFSDMRVYTDVSCDALFQMERVALILAVKVHKGIDQSLLLFVLVTSIVTYLFLKLMVMGIMGLDGINLGRNLKETTTSTDCDEGLAPEVQDGRGFLENSPMPVEVSILWIDGFMTFLLLYIFEMGVGLPLGVMLFLSYAFVPPLLCFLLQHIETQVTQQLRKIIRTSQYDHHAVIFHMERAILTLLVVVFTGTHNPMLFIFFCTKLLCFFWDTGREEEEEEEEEGEEEEEEEVKIEDNCGGKLTKADDKCNEELEENEKSINANGSGESEDLKMEEVEPEDDQTKEEAALTDQVEVEKAKSESNDELDKVNTMPKQLIRAHESDELERENIRDKYEDVKEKLKKWEKDLKKEKDKHEKDRKEWEQEKNELAAKVSHALTLCQLCHARLTHYEENRSKWDEERDGLAAKLTAKTASSKYYKTTLRHLKENHSKLEEENTDLTKNLLAADLSSEHLRGLVHELRENCNVLKEEKNDLIAKLSAATAASELYKGLLHDSRF